MFACYFHFFPSMTLNRNFSLGFTRKKIFSAWDLNKHHRHTFHSYKCFYWNSSLLSRVIKSDLQVICNLTFNQQKVLKLEIIERRKLQSRLQGKANEKLFLLRITEDRMKIKKIEDENLRKSHLAIYFWDRVYVICIACESQCLMKIFHTSEAKKIIFFPMKIFEFSTSSPLLLLNMVFHTKRARKTYCTIVDD